jgi:hypothetical protein
MSCGMKAVKGLLVAAAVFSSLILPAYSQGMTHFSKRDSAPPAQNVPKIDEKAYKSALERIPAPDKQYDPWGAARPADAPKGTKNRTRP